MNDTIKAALITGVLGIVGAVTAALIGAHHGEQDAITQVNSQVENEVIKNDGLDINTVKDLINEYNNLVSENESLRKQNIQYNNELTKVRDESNTNSDIYNDEIEQLKDEINQLNEIINSFPNIQFRDLSLSIEGNYIPINSSNSSVIVNNRTYYADDFVNNILNSKTNVSIQNDTMYIGKIIKEKANLFDQWVLDSRYMGTTETWVDSYGNTHTNSLKFTNKAYIIYNLNEEYSLLKFKISISENSSIKSYNILTIKADNEIVYTSPELSKTTKPFEEIDIPINNCSLLKIEYGDIGNVFCILSDVEVYN